MTTRVLPRFRKAYKVVSAEVDTTMDEMQAVALGFFIKNFREERSEWKAVWEKLSKLARLEESEAARD